MNYLISFILHIFFYITYFLKMFLYDFQFFYSDIFYCPIILIYIISFILSTDLCLVVFAPIITNKIKEKVYLKVNENKQEQNYYVFLNFKVYIISYDNNEILIFNKLIYSQKDLYNLLDKYKHLLYVTIMKNLKVIVKI